MHSVFCMRRHYLPPVAYQKIPSAAGRDFYLICKKSNFAVFLSQASVFRAYRSKFSLTPTVICNKNGLLNKKQDSPRF
uniref:Uncharacterized protein n=1 Tax=Geobacillus sp. (strain Y4.1MC1) TaxID=581103 RepID=A0A7U3YCQ6_GEOS0